MRTAPKIIRQGPAIARTTIARTGARDRFNLTLRNLFSSCRFFPSFLRFKMSRFSRINSIGTNETNGREDSSNDSVDKSFIRKVTFLIMNLSLSLSLQLDHVKMYRWNSDYKDYSRLVSSASVNIHSRCFWCMPASTDRWIPGIKREKRSERILAWKQSDIDSFITLRGKVVILLATFQTNFEVFCRDSSTSTE